jgi:hypothetical protein
MQAEMNHQTPLTPRQPFVLESQSNVSWILFQQGPLCKLESMAMRHFLLLRIALIVLLAVCLVNCGGGGSKTTDTASSGSNPTAGGGSGGGGGGGTTSLPPVSADDYMRLDATPMPIDAETNQRFLVLDLSHNRIFVSNRFLNRVEVFSTINHVWIASISVPEPIGLDITPDDGKIVVATGTDYIYMIDSAALEVVRSVHVPKLPGGSGVYDQAFSAVTLSDGKVLLGLNTFGITGSGSAIWDPASNSFTQNAGNPPVSMWAGTMARSGDHSKVLLASSLTGGDIALFDVAAGNFKYGKYFGWIPDYLAGNRDGSRFAVFDRLGNLQLFDADLNEVARRTFQQGRGVIFSRDGLLLYVMRDYGRLTVFRTSDLSQLGDLNDPLSANTAYPTTPYDIDDSAMIYGIANRGVVTLDATHPRTLTGNMGSVWAQILPYSAPLNQAVETAATTSFSPGSAPTRVLFGGVLAPAVQHDTSGTIHAMAPPSSTAGAVHYHLELPTGLVSLTPEGFSYGPQVVYQAGSASPNSGGGQFVLYGHGLGSQASDLHVLMGGVAARLTSFSVGPPDEGNIFYPYPLTRAEFVVPPSVPGNADLSVSSPSGNTVVPSAVSYWQETKLALPAGSAALEGGVLDVQRQRIYYAAGNTIQVLSVPTKQFLAPFTFTSVPNLNLSAVALTPDNKTLVGVNFAGGTVLVIDPDDASNFNNIPVLDPTDTSLDPHPLQAAATSDGRVFVNIVRLGGTGCFVGNLRQVDLATLTVTTVPVPRERCMTEQSRIAGSRDGNVVAFTFVNSEFTWRAGNGFSYRDWIGSFDIAVSSDGGRVSSAYPFAVFDDQLNYLGTPYWIDLVAAEVEGILGLKMHPSGSLLYVPLVNAIDIMDTSTLNLRRRVALADQLAPVVDPLVISETGDVIYVTTQSGLEILDTAAAPLSFASVKPNSSDEIPALALTTSLSEAKPVLRSGESHASSSRTGQIAPTRRPLTEGAAPALSQASRAAMRFLEQKLRGESVPYPLQR